ncbi:MAG: hypothetical protein AUI14_00825 [Actinobacteria bacterium 13_2_20CM_2_71_6]|nr:MAG: hypothetical protein AUI14_00825 [Actinobacteria bacterium 13_2_20CM_2_71_6]
MYPKITAIGLAGALGVVLSIGFAAPAAAAPRTCLQDSGSIGCVSWSDGTLDYRATVQDVNGDRLLSQLDIGFYSAGGSLIGVDEVKVNDWEPPATVQGRRPPSAVKAVVNFCSGWQLSDWYPSCATPVTVRF